MYKCRVKLCQPRIGARPMMAALVTSFDHAKPWLTKETLDGAASTTLYTAVRPQSSYGGTAAAAEPHLCPYSTEYNLITGTWSGAEQKPLTIPQADNRRRPN